MYARLFLAALALHGATALAQSPGDALSAFRSDRELDAYLRRLTEARPERRPPTVACSGKSTATKPVHVAAEGAVIHGQVRDIAGNKLTSGSVTTSAPSLTTTTDTGGSYRLAIPAAMLASSQTIVLTTRHLGFSPGRHTLKVAAGDSVTVNFSLCQQPVSLMSVVATATGESSSDAVTNTQHAGVDEGGIVKLRGEYLVILRRGRLFTMAVGDDDLRAVSTVDAFGPGIDPQHAWYDELLVSGDRVVVIGFSYMRGGTEIGVFHLDRAGGLHHESTYHLRSNDYYSSRNYASRLVGSTLVLYAPLYLSDRFAPGDDPLDALPAMRKWRAGAESSDFRTIASHTRVYRSARELDPSRGVALHSVTTCDLSRVELECEATVVIGLPGRVFYVSPNAVYVWTVGWGQPVRDDAAATLYRLPLDGSRPTAVGVSGGPIDQFSFLESDDGYLNVVVRSAANGDGMWRAEETAGSTSLLRLPLASFRDGSRAAPWWRYRALPAPTGATVQNRFVGRYLLYGAGNGWGPARRAESHLVVVRWKTGDLASVTLPHGADRIEPMGEDAVVIGTDGKDLHFSGVLLGTKPEVAQHFALSDASQGELRSHGFFYKADGPTTGVLGLPVRGPGRPGYEHLFHESAGIVFLRNADGRFQQLGNLDALIQRAEDDVCKVSCVDWYGNSRPLFVRGRVLALLGYELVEGTIRSGRMVEKRRITYAPVAR